MAHIDHNSGNNDPDNLLFLCLTHHNAYDTRQSQAKNYTELEVKQYRTLLDEFVKSELPSTWLASKSFPNRPSSEPRSTPANGTFAKVSLDVYDRRLPVYLAARDFLVKIIRDAKASWKDIARFAQDTDQAIFLFGPDLADYLRTIYKKAVHLNFYSTRLETPERWSNEEWRRLVDEEGKILKWFENEMDSLRHRFAPFMTLKDG